MHLVLARPLTATLGALLRALRPKQWTKNSVMFIGLVFALKLGEPALVGLALAAFAAFCLLSSGVYLINDLVDLERDRQHPVKRQRPLASGDLPVGMGMATAAFLLPVALGLSFLINWRFGLIALAYLLLNLGYSFALKHVVILDVFAIGAGFVLRVVGGAVAINVPVSPWLYVCTILGALFLGLTKRRHELLLLEAEAGHHRRILQEYSPQLLDQLTTIVTATLVMAYSLYTFSAENLPRNHAMMLTIPFVLYGVFRYLYLVHQRNAGGSPEDLLWQDRPLLATCLLWGVTVVALLYGLPRG